MTTPYITPQTLRDAPTGISWSTIPTNTSTAQEQAAEQLNICWRATHMIDAYCSQPLRATVDTEDMVGPDARLTIDAGGMSRVVTSRWPVIAIVAASVAPARAFPVVWSSIPVDRMIIETNLDGLYASTVPGAGGGGPNAIDIAPGYLSWINGRNGYRLRLQYINGWPHGQITASVAASVSTIAVDDCTGCAGANMQIYDSANTEMVHVDTASASVGPGTLTLSTPLSFAHAAGVVISALPATIQQAAIYAAVTQALTRGANAITVQALPGGMAPASSLGTDALTKLWHDLVQPYRRVI